MSVTALVQQWQGQFSARDGSATAGGGPEIDPIDIENGTSARFVLGPKPSADAMAADATTAQNIFTVDATSMPNGVKIESVQYLPQGTLTANATNFATLIVEKATGAGAATTVASFATDTVTTDDLVALVAKTIPVTASASIVAAGQSVSFRITKTASGVAVPAGRFQVNYKVL